MKNVEMSSTRFRDIGVQERLLKKMYRRVYLMIIVQLLTSVPIYRIRLTDLKAKFSCFCVFFPKTYFSLLREIVVLIRERFRLPTALLRVRNFQRIEIMVIFNNRRDRDQFSEKTLPCEGETITHLRLCSCHSLRLGISLPVKSVKAPQTLK